MIFSGRLTWPSTYIGTIDLKENKSSKLLEFENYNLKLGDYQDMKLLYIKQNIINLKIESMNIYDFKDESEIYSIKLDEIGFSEIKSPVIRDNKSIFFIGKIFKGENIFIEDIYMLDLVTGNLQQISFDGNIKDYLSYYGNRVL